MRIGTLRHVLWGTAGVRVVWVIAACVGLVVLGEILIVDPLGSLLEKMGLGAVSGDSPDDWSSALGSVLKRMARVAVVLGGVHLVLRLLAGSSLASIGLRVTSRTASHAFLGIGLGFLIEAVSVLLAVTFGWYSVEGFSWEYASVSLVGAAAFYGVFFAVETAALEETLFRGLLLQFVRPRSGTVSAVALSSGLFGLLHFSGFGDEFPWWMSILSATTVGLLFAQALLASGTLWVPMGIHFGWHLAARLLGSVGVGPGEALLLVTEVRGPALLVSTRSGGAGVFELVGVVLASLVILRQRRPVRGAPVHVG
jgi:membrane protease YdiL (CAAX protease family)